MEINPNDFNSKGKIPNIEKAFEGSEVAKKVAYMIATSHEYTKPNTEHAIKLVKNYTWEERKLKTSDLQGINKPVIKEKVFDMAKSIKPEKLKPLMVVNKFQGITPQTPGKKILLDGHHRLEACIFKGIKEVPVYYGKYNGSAEKPISELIGDKKASDVIEELIEKSAEFNKRTKLKVYNKKRVEMTPEEKKLCRDKKAVWNNGDLAVFKAVDKDGDTAYITHTHRALSVKPTLKGAIERFHNFIKSTASEYAENDMEKSAKFTEEDAKEQLKKLNYNTEKLPFSLKEFAYGMNVELEHGTKPGKDTNVTDNNPLKTAKITLVHLKESPDYYKELRKIETKFEKKASGVIDDLVEVM